MANFVQLPNGSLFPAKEGEDFATTMRAAYAEYPEAFGGEKAEAPKKAGMMGALGKGLEGLLSSGQTAFGAVTGSPEEAAAAAAERQKAIDQKYADQVSFDKVKEAYEKNGVLSAGKEALSQVPAAIAEQAPNLAVMAGGAAAGSVLGPIGAVAGAALPALVQQFGGNIERQAQEGQPIDRTKAALAAVPQAALDVAGNFIPFGGKLVSKLTGIPEKAFFSKSAAGAEKLANERLLTTLAKGTATGVLAEVPTEIAQQMLERAQAGLSLTDQDAMNEYGKTAYQVGLLGPLGAVGRMSEKSAAQQELENKQPPAPPAPAPEEPAAPAEPLQLGYTPGLPNMKEPATPAPMDLNRLMEEHDRLKAQEEQLAQTMSESHEAYTTLRPQQQDLNKQLTELGNLIEAHGGVTTTPEEFEAQSNITLSMLDNKIKNAKTALAKATDPNQRDYEAADALSEKINKLNNERAAAAKDIEAKRANLTAKTENQQLRGQNRDLFTPEEAPVPVAQTQEEALSAAQPAKPTEVAKAETQPQPSLMDNKTLDIFSPENQIRTAISNNDEVALNRIAQAEDRRQRDERYAESDEQALRDQRLMEALEGRLNLGGKEGQDIEHKRVNYFEQHYDAKQQAEFKNGTNVETIKQPSGKDISLQEVYDKGGPAAVEYELIKDAVGQQRRKIETRQGNAKQSVLEQLEALAAEHNALQAQLESGIATPTMGEKVENLKAKQGKAEPRAEREMDAAEKHQMRRKIASLANKFNTLVETKVKPVRAEIDRIHAKLYQKTTPEQSSVVEKRAADERQRRAHEKTATGKVSKTRAATTAARINKGDVRKEAMQTQALEDLAQKVGQESDAYEKMVNTQVRRLDALKKKYGANDPAVNAYRIEVSSTRDEAAREIGRKSPEYKQALAAQVKKLQSALEQTGEQKVQSKRTKQATRNTGVSKTPDRTGSPESRALTTAKTLRMQGTKMTNKDIDALVKEINDTDGGTAYRMRESEGAVVDAKEAADFMDTVQKNLPENVKLVYAPTTGKIPVRLLKMMAAEGVNPTEGMVQGAVFSDGTVLVVGDQHADLKDLEETVVHELVGHYGIDTLIGMEKLQNYANKTDLRKLAEEIGGEQLLQEVQRTAASTAALGYSEEKQKLQVLREIIAHTEEARVTESFRAKAGRWMKELVGMVRAGLRSMGFSKMPAMSNSDVFYALKKSRQAFANKTIGAYRAADGQIAFRSRTEPVRWGKSVMMKQTSIKDKLLGNFLGLAGRVQLVDQHAALSEAFKQGMDKGMISSLEGGNAEFFLRFGQQRSQYASQFLTNGAVKLKEHKTDAGTEYTYESTKGTNMMDVAEAFHKAKIGNDSETEAAATLYLSGLRAKQVGWNKLNYSKPSEVEAEYNELMAHLKTVPGAEEAFKEGAKLYQEYNNGLLDFLVQTGALGKAKAAELKAINYVPFYRVSQSGDVQLMIDSEHPVRIANIKDEPQLKELVGGNDQILPLFTSSVQNTFMLTDMALRNQTVKNSAFVLKKIGIASHMGEGKGPQSPNTVRFKLKGEDYYVTIDKDQYGIPADLIVKGMEGIKTTLPAVVKLMAVPADILRSFVTRNPVYALRQVVRDPLNAWLTTGTDATPVLSSMKELAHMVAGRSEAETKLMQSGAISSNVFSGDQRDMSKFLKDIAAGKSGWERAMAKLDALAMQGDASTRAVVYKDSLAKGMTEQQALLRTLESMNFSRRGLSPSMQMLSTMIPFFNAQIQGLDVLYRAFKGDMPFSKQLDIKAKLVQRGLMLAAGTAAYAMLMSDDEAYKRAKPEERYGNWFVYVPGVSEPVRVPIPFELGYLFKALPEAIYNMAANDEKTSKAVGGLYKLLEQSNPFALPQAVKPLTEAVLGKSFYGGDIESKREQNVLATERYRDTTTELSKLLGSVTGKAGVSPITLDYLIRGYTGPLGIALVQMANPILATELKASVAEPTLKASKTPFIGGLFQPVEGRGTLDEAYDRMTEIQQTKGTYNQMVEKGNRAEARAFAQEHASELAMASSSGSVQKYLGEIAKQERMIRSSPTLTTEQKDERLAKLDKMKTEYARKFIALADKTTRP